MTDFFIFINLLLIVVFIMFIIIPNNLLTYLLLGEMVWILLYALLAVMGLGVDSPVLLSITLFCLVLSGLEFALGLVIFFFY